MKDLKGKTAVITGGGGGLGRGMGLAFAEAGMNIVVSDIDASAAHKVADEISALGVRALVHQTDVIERDELKDLADRSFAEFGETNILCNNAGVSTFHTADAIRDEDWAWVLGVNLHGVIHGIQEFLPRMKAQQGDAHIVNTASIAGLTALPGLAPYTASKFAVLGISETLHAEREVHGVGCSVLCPAFVNTGIANSERNRPDAFGTPTGSDNSMINAALQTGLDPKEVGRMVRTAVLEEEFYILTHPETRASSELRANELLAAFDRWAKRLA